MIDQAEWGGKLNFERSCLMVPFIRWKGLLRQSRYRPVNDQRGRRVVRTDRLTVRNFDESMSFLRPGTARKHRDKSMSARVHWLLYYCMLESVRRERTLWMVNVRANDGYG